MSTAGGEKGESKQTYLVRIRGVIIQGHLCTYSRTLHVVPPWASGSKETGVIRKVCQGMGKPKYHTSNYCTISLADGSRAILSSDLRPRTSFTCDFPCETARKVSESPAEYVCLPKFAIPQLHHTERALLKDLGSHEVFLQQRSLKHEVWRSDKHVSTVTTGAIINEAQVQMKVSSTSIFTILKINYIYNKSMITSK